MLPGCRGPLGRPNVFFYLSPPFPSAVHDPITRFVSRSQIPASSWRGLCCPKMCPGVVLREEGRPGGEQEEGGEEKEPLFAWLKGSTQPWLAGCRLPGLQSHYPELFEPVGEELCFRLPAAPRTLFVS